jgi:inhibitor of cysteine peptidase
MTATMLALLGIICIIAVAFSGCTGTGTNGSTTPTPTPVGTAIPVGNLVVSEAQNGATVSASVGSTITLKLAENPTTGYSWNLTTSSGLQVASDTYQPSDTTGKMVGSGGTHVWDIRAIQPGNQTIRAIYMRPWMPVAGNETAFAMTVNVAG